MVNTGCLCQRWVPQRWGATEFGHDCLASETMVNTTNNSWFLVDIWIRRRRIKSVTCAPVLDTSAWFCWQIQNSWIVPICCADFFRIPKLFWPKKIGFPPKYPYVYHCSEPALLIVLMVFVQFIKNKEVAVRWDVIRQNRREENDNDWGSMDVFAESTDEISWFIIR